MQNTFNILYIYHCKNRKNKQTNKHPNSQTLITTLFLVLPPLSYFHASFVPSFHLLSLHLRAVV